MTEEINITWQRLIPRQKIEKLIKPERGLYQFYGYHPVYGKKVLLYIGMASDIRSRLLSHEFLSEGVPDILRPNSISIRVAYIPDLTVDIDAVEHLLIFMHSPAWNSEGVRYTQHKYRELIVHNNGNLGKLRKVVNGRDLFRKDTE